MKQQVELKVARKKGPFYLRSLKLKELMQFFSDSAEMEEHERVVALVTKTLVNGNDAPVFKDSKTLEDQLSGASIIWLGLKAQEVNELDKLQKLPSMVEDAEKN